MHASQQLQGETYDLSHRYKLINQSRRVMIRARIGLQIEF